MGVKVKSKRASGEAGKGALVWATGMGYARREANRDQLFLMSVSLYRMVTSVSRPDPRGTEFRQASSKMVRISRAASRRSAFAILRGGDKMTIEDNRSGWPTASSRTQYDGLSQSKLTYPKPVLLGDDMVINWT